MKKMLIFLLALSVTAGGAFAQDDNGSWSFSGEAQVNGGINLPLATNSDDTGGSSSVDADTPTMRDKGDINGKVDVTFKKTDKWGADFSMALGFSNDKTDRTRITLKFDWARTLGAGTLKTGVGLDSGDDDGRRVNFTAGYSEDLFGVNLAMRSWLDDLIGPFMGKRGPNTSTGYSFRDNIFFLTTLNGWIKTMDNQLTMFLRYRGGDNTNLRASDIVARDFNKGDDSIGLTFAPAAVPGLTIGTTVMVRGYTQDGRDITPGFNGGVASQSLFFTAGAKYALNDDIAFHFQGHSGRQEMDRLWGDLDADKDDLDGDFEAAVWDALNSYDSANLDKVMIARSGTGFDWKAKGAINAGVSVTLPDVGLGVKADLEVVGLDNIKTQGWLGLGIGAEFSTGDLTASLGFKLYNSLWDAVELLFDGDKDNIPDFDGYKYSKSFGLLIIEPSVSYGIIPDTLSAELNMVIKAGLTTELTSSKDNGEQWDNYGRFKINPQFTWSINGDSRTQAIFGYEIEFDTGKAIGSRDDGYDQHDKLTGHALKLGFKFKF